MTAYVVVVEGLSALDDISEIEEKALRAARMAVNKAADRTRKVSADAMREQINFPARYLSGKSGRLAVTRRASGSRLEAAIAGRDRPTSLARFASKSSKGRGATVTVKPGSPVTLQRAFLMQLKNGNTGLAVRTDGSKPSRAWRPKRIAGSNIWLLYGPSVDQVFKAVAREEGASAALDFLEREFNRLMKL